MPTKSRDLTKTTTPKAKRAASSGSKDLKARAAVIALRDLVSQMVLPSNCDAPMARLNAAIDDF